LGLGILKFKFQEFETARTGCATLFLNHSVAMLHQYEVSVVLAPICKILLFGQYYGFSPFPTIKPVKSSLVPMHLLPYLVVKVRKTVPEEDIHLIPITNNCFIHINFLL
jgi:hypothetical protein